MFFSFAMLYACILFPIWRSPSCVLDIYIYTYALSFIVALTDHTLSSYVCSLACFLCSLFKVFSPVPPCSSVTSRRLSFPFSLAVVCLPYSSASASAFSFVASSSPLLLSALLAPFSDEANRQLANQHQKTQLAEIQKAAAGWHALVRACKPRLSCRFSCSVLFSSRTFFLCICQSIG